MADGHDHSAPQFEATLDAVEQLKAILRDEHSLLTQYKMIVWGRVFTPVQARMQLCCQAVMFCLMHRVGSRLEASVWCMVSNVLSANKPRHACHS